MLIEQVEHRPVGTLRRTQVGSIGHHQPEQNALTREIDGTIGVDE